MRVPRRPRGFFDRVPTGGNRNTATRRSRSGHAVVELSLMMPWLFFLFVGTLDFGFVAHGLISVQNATRIATLNAGFSTAAAASQQEACYHVRRELATMPNASLFSTTCSASPLVVTVTPFVDSEGASASRVEVTYKTVPLMPLPGGIFGNQTIRRSAEIKVFGE